MAMLLCAPNSLLSTSQRTHLHQVTAQPHTQEEADLACPLQILFMSLGATNEVKFWLEAYKSLGGTITCAAYGRGSSKRPPSQSWLLRSVVRANFKRRLHRSSPDLSCI